MIWTKVLGRTFILVGWWFDVKRMIIHFSKASISPKSLYSIHTFSNHWWKIASAARNWINSNDDLCLLFCLYPSFKDLPCMEELIWSGRGGWRVYIVYITSGRRTVRLDSLQGLYERFLIANLIRYSCSHTGRTVQARAPLHSILSLCYHVGTHLKTVETPYLYRQAEDPGYLILFVGGKRFPFAPPLPYL